MSIPVDVADVPTGSREFDRGYLLTSRDGQVKVVSVRAVAQDGTLVVPAPGPGSVRNVGANPRVTLLFPPVESPGMTCSSTAPRPPRATTSRHRDERDPAQTGRAVTTSRSGSARSSTSPRRLRPRGRVLAGRHRLRPVRAPRPGRRVRRRWCRPTATTTRASRPSAGDGRLHLDLRREPTHAAEGRHRARRPRARAPRARVRRAPLARQLRLLLRHPPGVAPSRGSHLADGNRSRVDQVCLDIHAVVVRRGGGVLADADRLGPRAIGGPGVRPPAPARRAAAAVAAAAPRRRAWRGGRAPGPLLRRPAAERATRPSAPPWCAGTSTGP